MSKRVKPSGLTGFAAAVEQVNRLCLDKSDNWKKGLFAEFLCDALSPDSRHPGQVSPTKQNEIFSGKYSAATMRAESEKICVSARVESFVQQVHNKTENVEGDAKATRIISAFAWWLEDKKYLLDLAAGNREREFAEAGFLEKLKMKLGSVKIPQTTNPAVARPPVPGADKLDGVLLEANLGILSDQLSKIKIRELEARLAALKSGRGPGGGSGGAGNPGRGNGGGGTAVSGKGRVTTAKRIFPDDFSGIDFPVAPTTPIIPSAGSEAAKSPGVAVSVAIPVAATTHGKGRDASSR